MRRARGFTLIEVLVTLFVVAVGLLSVAGLQAISKKVNYDAVQRTTATALALSIVERMRANPDQLLAYVTSDAGTATGSIDCSAAAAACTPEQVAAFDLTTWADALEGTSVTADGDNAGGLVEPTGCVFATAQPGLYVVAVAWRGITGVDAPGNDDPADDPARNACGNGLGRYDDPRETGADDRLRRVVVMNVIVADPYAA
ncbi:MAG TPA: type IV pilus modification protein PilV [Nevskiaceae bacterium]|nr:type IV pilus modification protein PilV [Nevskiaceae bacterium]